MGTNSLQTSGPCEGYRLFIEAPGFEFHQQPFDHGFSTRWLSRCIDIQCLDVIAQNICPYAPSPDLQTKFDLAMQIDFHESTIKPYTILQYLGLQASDARLATLRSSQNHKSILDYVATGIFDPVFEDTWTSDFVRLGLEVLKNAGDPWSLLVTKGKTEQPSPFFSYIDYLLQFSLYSNLALLRRFLERLGLWVDMVSRAGIDICQYGVREAERWRSLQSTNRYKLVYGRTPAEWSLETRDFVELTTFELRTPPGSFPLSRDERVPTKICWPPSAKEWHEGPWAEVGRVSLVSRPYQIKAVKSPAFKRAKLFSGLLAETQDDAREIALLQLRAPRSRNSASRSQSQPSRSPLKRRDQSTHCAVLGGFYLRHWLAGCHLCTDSKWTLGRNCGYPWQVDNIALDGCIRQSRDESMVKRQRSVQESFNWCNASFLASISACQDGEVSMPWQRPKAIHCHTGRADCPLGCGTVNLDQLHVPTELKLYHPTRSFVQIGR